MRFLFLSLFISLSFLLSACGGGTGDEDRGAPAASAVTDSRTGLIWQNRDDGLQRDWNDAMYYCEDLTLDGFTDWHVPTFSELRGLIDCGPYSSAPDDFESLPDYLTCADYMPYKSPVIDETMFPGTKPDAYWSSDRTEYNGVRMAKVVIFDDGSTPSGALTNRHYVRCVRTPTI